MPGLLSPAGLSRLSRFARRELLVAFDFDGTLAPLTARPEAAWMRGETFVLLGQVAALYPCAVLSGRARTDLLPRLPGVAVRWVVGNHGLEWPGEPRSDLRERVAGWREVLEPRLVGLSGVAVEDKGLSLAVHYREAPNPTRTLKAIEVAAVDLPQCRSERGILVVNLLPAEGPDKGAALVRLRELAHCTHALFVGDDVTDEAVFRLGSRRVLSVRVGASKDSRADYHLDDQAGVDALLRALLRARTFDADQRGG